MIDYFESVFGPYPFESAGGTVVGAPIGFALETQTVDLWPDPAVGEHATDGPGAGRCGGYRGPRAGASVVRRRRQPAALARHLVERGIRDPPRSSWLEHTRRVGPDHHLAYIYAFHAALLRFRILSISPRSMPGMSSRAIGTSAADSSEPLSATTSCATTRKGSGRPRWRIWRTSPARRAWLNWQPSVSRRTISRPCRAHRRPRRNRAFLTDDRLRTRRATLHALRLTVGDEAFFTILRTWTCRPQRQRNHRGLHRAAEEISGQQLDDFFDAWLSRLPCQPYRRRATRAPQQRPRLRGSAFFLLALEH